MLYFRISKTTRFGGDVTQSNAFILNIEEAKNLMIWILNAKINSKFLILE